MYVCIKNKECFKILKCLPLFLSLPGMDENFSTESNSQNCSCFTACFGSSKNKLYMVKAKDKNTSASSTFRADKSLASHHRDIMEQPQTPVKKNNLATTGSWMTFIPSPTHAPQTNIRPNSKPKKLKNQIEEEEEGYGEVIDLDKNRKKEANRTGSVNSGSPPVEKNITKPSKVLHHSVSLPVLTDRKKEQPIPGGGEKNNKVDPIVGMSIVLVTLVIMLIWGKLCAIICSFGWLFMVPRLKAVIGESQNGLNSGAGLDLDSEEYKKKVVLDGLLQRQRLERGRHHTT